MRLDVLTLEDCQQVRLWRNQCLETLRTPYPLTEAQQTEFYKSRVCNPNSPHRYWGVYAEPDKEKECGLFERGCDGDGSEIPKFIGMGGLTYIQWENRIAEISLIIDPTMRGKGLGEKAVDLLLEQAFDRLGLKTVFGESYVCGEAHKFWARVTDKYHTYVTMLPNRKFWNGQWWNSMYFSIDCNHWR